jgi:hypothetical protein
MKAESVGRGTAEALRMATARAVAAHEVPDDVLESVGQQLAKLPTADLIRGIDICTYGICIDYFVEPDRWRELLEGVVEGGPRIRHIDWFPWGIIQDDLIQMRVEYQFDELAAVAVPQVERKLRH